jgi:hypothetical protein
MGYTTEFDGSFDLDRKLSSEHRTYLEAFANTRRMKRNPNIAATFEDPVREAVGLPIGEEGEYFVRWKYMAQDYDESTVDCNFPPSSQPSLWCHWVPNAYGSSIEWDGGEKFYYYVEWIRYLIQHFLKPWGYVLNGKVFWRGEDFKDVGTIEIVDNVVSAKRAF